MPKTVFGLMDHFPEAQATVRDLAAAGFRRENPPVTAANQAALNERVYQGEETAEGEDAAGVERRKLP